MYLSKSLYTRGLQCAKSLWLKKYKPEVLQVPTDRTVFETGDMVGDLACGLFAGGKEVPYEGTSFDEKIALTRRWIEEGVSDIYEASFSFQDIFVMVDILHINANGSMEINEVKSSTEVKDVYLHDASVQYYVLSGLGLDVKRTNIIHINNKYIRDEELELDKLFSIVDVSSEVKELQRDIPSRLANFEKMLENTQTPPPIDIGTHCFNPYECDAKSHCWAHIPAYSIFDISNLKAKQKFELYKRGIINIEEIPDGEPFNDSQMVQINSHKNDTTTIDADKIKAFLRTLRYPIYHLDFETYQQAIPQFRGVGAYMQIPFQYSIHIEHEDGRLEHREFLAQAGKDPRAEIAEKLTLDIPPNVTVLAYNMSFEKSVIKHLAAAFPDFSSKLMSIHDNILDLMLPFWKKWYYAPKMLGSYSIKSVMPSLVPDMEKAYKNLDGIHEGGEAMSAFAHLADKSEDEQSIIRTQLLEYCKLDTFAMVKVLQKLREVVNTRT